MSIRVEGTLLVKKIRGRNGPFCIGDLITEIGEFKVKDPLIDQFEEGQYTGRFWVSQIYPTSYFAFGKAVIEIRAKLSDLLVDGEDNLPNDEKPQEPDPAEEKPQAPDSTPPALPEAAVASSEPEDRPDSQETAETSKDVTASPDLAPFGEELWPQVESRQAVKLDPTVDRLRFRQQRDRLKTLGYAFNVKNQTWSIAEQATD